MNWIAIVVGIPFTIMVLWVVYRIAVAGLSAGSYDDQARNKDCDKTAMDEGCITCMSYTVVAGRGYCKKHKIWGE